MFQEIESLREEVLGLKNCGLATRAVTAWDARLAREESSWWQQIIVRKGLIMELPQGKLVVYAGAVALVESRRKGHTPASSAYQYRVFRMALNFDGDQLLL
jgi:hypothetical protein